MAAPVGKLTPTGEVYKGPVGKLTATGVVSGESPKSKYQNLINIGLAAQGDISKLANIPFSEREAIIKSLNLPMLGGIGGGIVGG